MKYKTIYKVIYNQDGTIKDLEYRNEFNNIKDVKNYLKCTYQELDLASGDYFNDKVNDLQPIKTHDGDFIILTSSDF